LRRFLKVSIFVEIMEHINKHKTDKPNILKLSNNIIMNYKTIIILLGVLSIFGTSAFTQNQTSLQGSVISSADEKIEFYTLILQSAADSSVVSVDMFSDTVFRFVAIKPQTYILRLQDIQYQPYDTLITVVEGTNVLNTPLVLKPKTLEEIVVRGLRPVLAYDQGNIAVDVANSYLKDDISVTNILGKLPGVIINNKEEISVFGKSNLLIYINGMQARSGDEYKSLQPGDIEKIEIIRNVGSEYEANVDAVIKITTKKRREEKYHISISNALEKASYLTNTPSLSLYLGGREKVSQYITLTNVVGKSKDHHKSYAYTYFDNYTYSNFRDDYDFYKYGNISLFYSLNYSPDKDKTLGIQYSGRFSDLLDHVDGTRFYDDETTSSTVNLNSDEQSKTNTSIINVNYKQQVNTAGELSVVADYMFKTDNTVTDIEELATDWNAHNIIDADINGTVFSITPEYKIAGKKFTYSAGLKYSYLNNKSSTEFHSSLDVVQTSEHLTGAYLIFNANLSFVDIKAGLRMEYTNSELRSGDGLNDMNREYFNLIPNISLSRDLNEHLNLTMYYRRTLSRPGIRNLRSTITYWDSLTYVTGNPRLKPAMTDAIGLNAGIYKFDFTLEYKTFSDRVIFHNISDSENPNRTIHTYTNIKEKHNELTVGVSRSFNHRIFTNMTSIHYNRQFNLRMPFRGEIIRFNRPKYVIKTSGDVTIFKNTSLGYAFFYNNGGDMDFLRWNKSYSYFDLTLSQYLMKKKLLISFSVEDVFNKFKGNRWTQYHANNILYTQDSDAIDSRFAVFKIRYNWGIQKSIRKKSSDTDHINRL
jgi:hypothetical protein